MLSSVIVDGEVVRIDPQNVAGAGGEGTVAFVQFRGKTWALKIYHTPTPERGQKLADFLRGGYALDKVFHPPEYLAEKPKTNHEIVGFLMSPLPQGFAEIRYLSDTDYRTANGIDTKKVTDVFVNGGYAIAHAHRELVVIGDLNDLNTLFLRNGIMLFIDIDSMQFGKWGCPVATEEFVDLNLYGFDWASGVYFSPESDWYSYATMLFKSLLLVHPYKGIHPMYKKLPSRAKNKAFVLGPDIIYPQKAYPPELLTDDLAQIFWRIFSTGERFPFPVVELEQYQTLLIKCKKCKAWYPSTRLNCPICSAVTVIPIKVKPKPQVIAGQGQGVTMTELIRTEGPILLTRVIGETVYVIARENNAAVLYTKELGQKPESRPIVKDDPGTTYGLMKDSSDRLIMAIGKPEDVNITLIEVSEVKLKGLLQTTTMWSYPKRSPVFAVADNYLFRISGSELLAGTFSNGEFIERHVRNITKNQTWFDVNPSLENPMVFGFFQVARDRIFWFGHGGEMYDIEGFTLDDDEADTPEWSAQFSSRSVLLQRVTQKRGIEYQCTVQIDAKGKIVYNRKVKRDDLPHTLIHGTAYTTGIIFHATDNGLVMETLIPPKDASYSVLSGGGSIREGDKLFKYGRNLLVAKTNIVYEVTFN